MKVVNILKIIILTIIASACSSSSIKVSSNPKGAKVYLRDIGSKDKKELGITPLSITQDKLKKLIKDDGLFSLIIEHELYYSKEIYVTEATQKEMVFEFVLEKLPKIGAAHNIDEIVERFFTCQRFIRVKRFQDCHQVLNNLIDKYPEVSTIYEFQGTIYYLNNEKEKAIQAFNTALKYNANNAESSRMLKVINMELNQ
jgi:hypothetical protein